MIKKTKTSEEKKFEIFIKQNKNLPDYFTNLILWKLNNEKTSSFWFKKMTKQIKLIQKYL